jgi:hypothetical protein
MMRKSDNGSIIIFHQSMLKSSVVMCGIGMMCLDIQIIDFSSSFVCTVFTSSVKGIVIEIHE